MKVLVTGANGYLGVGIVKELLDKGMTVVATDVVTDKVDSRAIQKECDLFQLEQPYEYFEQPDVLLHLAWRDGFLHFSDAHIIDLPNHYQFIKKMVESSIKSIAIMGSMHEVGFFEGSIDENTPCNPESLYGIAKNTLREVAQVFADKNGKIFKWFRGYYIVGNTAYGSSIFSKIVKAAEQGQKYFPFTMGTNQYDFIEYQDFCKQVAIAVGQNEINGIINICSGVPEKLSERVERFISENRYNIKLEYGAFPERPYDSKAIWGNDRKIKEIISNYKNRGGCY